MRVEIHASGGPTCETCGSFPLLHVRELPLSHDLEPLLELEMLRREARLARWFMDAHNELLQEAAEEKVVHSAEIDVLMAEREQLQQDVDSCLAAAKIDVSRWHMFRRRREQRFSERLAVITGELLELTRWPLTGTVDEPAVVDRS